jgi:hypothetical protein
MSSYELWAHRWSGDIFAVRLHADHVTGVCGPLSLLQAVEADLATLTYDERPEAVYRAQEHPEQFSLAEPWIGGRSVPVRRRWRWPRRAP